MSIDRRRYISRDQAHAQTDYRGAALVRAIPVGLASINKGLWLVTTQVDGGPGSARACPPYFWALRRGRGTLKRLFAPHLWVDHIRARGEIR